MKILITNKNGTEKAYNAAAHVVEFYQKRIEELEKQLRESEEMRREVERRQDARFKGFAALVFSPVVSIEKTGQKTKQINFENGVKIRYNVRSGGDVRFCENSETEQEAEKHV